MKPLCKSAILTAILAAVALAALVPQASAQTPPPGLPILLGTIGACNNAKPGGACTQTSTLVQIDPSTGALVQVIGPVGFTVNGLAWDSTTDTLYATTATGDTAFHGLITIDPNTGAGTPVNPSLVNFGLSPDPRFIGSPIHSLTIDSNGHLAAWYDEFPPPVGVTDTFVTIDKATGIATEFENTGLDTNQNGLAFAKHDLLWNIDAPKTAPDGSVTQTVYQLNPANGQPVDARDVAPPIAAALGDFDPVGNKYYGLNFLVFTPQTALIVIDLKKGTVTAVGATVDDLHVIAFVKHHLL
jgi:DNA-binding beta-propeller fold protein YncE